MNRSATVDIMPLNTQSRDGDLEYHVVYSQRQHLPHCKVPVAVLFGWGGCNDKYLAKYSVIYEEAGCTTLRCIVSPKMVFPGTQNENKLKSTAEKIVNVMKSLKFEAHPVYFHSFSNAGSSVYCCVSETIRSRADCNFQIKGCIFDSAPAKIYASNIVTAVHDAVNGSTTTKYSYAFMVLLYMYAIAGFNWISSFIHCRRPSTKRFIMYHTLCNEPNVCPQLFLYSKVDDVCPYESIKEFVELRKQQGVDVTSVVWENSPHVKHLVMHKETYISSVMKFIKPNLCCIAATNIKDKN